MGAMAQGATGDFVSRKRERRWLGDLFEIASMLPWWLEVALAIAGEAPTEATETTLSGTRIQSQ